MKAKKQECRPNLLKETPEAFFIKPEKEFKIRKRFFQMHRNFID
jgi:hypothetical protein